MSTRPAPRLKTFWFDEQRTRSPQEVASAAAAVVWRTAAHRIANLRHAGFAIEPGADYANVLVELACLMIAVADRVALRFARRPAAEGKWRTAFTSALAHGVGELLQDSLDDLLGPDPQPGRGWRRRFVDRVNVRLAEYGQFECGDDGPSFAMLRTFGERMEEMVADAGDRRWIADQAMTVDGPGAAETIDDAMRALLGQRAKPARRAMSGD